MLELTVEHETDTAHRLSCHKGKCRNLHGHRYKFVVTVDVQGTIEDGERFMDFYSFKQKVRTFLDDLFDHCTILCNNEANESLIQLMKENNLKMLLLDKEPTVEHMCEWLVDLLNTKELFDGRLKALTIYETPINSCTWRKAV